MTLLKQPIVQAAVIGVVGLFLQKIATHFIFDRINELSELRKNTAYKLVFFANAQQGSSNFNQAQDEFRQLAASVFGLIHRRTCILFWMPNKRELRKVADALIGLSNSLDSSDYDHKKNCRRKIINGLLLSIDE